MEDSSYILLVIMLAQSLLLLCMLLLVVLFIRKRGLSTSVFRRNRKQIEQQMVIEAISAAANKTGFKEMLDSVGAHAAAITGCRDWVLAIREDNGGFCVQSARIDGRQDEYGFPSLAKDAELVAWVKRNQSAARLGNFAASWLAREMRIEEIQAFADGLMIPLIDGRTLLGFILLGGKVGSNNRPNNLFLNLFGTTSAILVKTALQNMRELQLINERRRAQTMEHVGQMAARLAHEIRNPLTFIKSAAGYLGKEESPEKTETTRKAVLEEIDRINTRINELLSVSTLQPGLFGRLNIVEIVSKALEFTSRHLEEAGIRVEKQFPDEQILVRGDTDRLLQLFENLFLNAGDAISENGRIRVSAEAIDGFCYIHVIDNGHGIPTEMQDRVFDPFFTTKKKGTGLGLAIGDCVARSHGGSLRVCQSSGSGTDFLLTLPLSRD